jgi:hypothetical protein
MSREPVKRNTGGTPPVLLGGGAHARNISAQSLGDSRAVSRSRLAAGTRGQGRPQQQADERSAPG